MRSSAGALAAALVVLAGCDTTLPWSSGSSGTSGGGSGASITVSPLTLAFTAQEGGATPASQAAVLGVQGSVYVAVQHSGAAVASAALVQTSPSTADVVVTPAAPVAAGSFTGTVTVIGCSDATCTAQVPGSPATITVTYDVSAQTLGVSPASLAFDHVVGAASPAPQSLAVSDPASTGYTASISYAGTSGWLSLDRTSGTLPDTIGVTVNPASLSSWSYSATVTVTTSSGSRNVPVTLVVRQPTLQAPASVAFAAVRDQAPLPAPKTLALGTDAGAPVAFGVAVTYGPGASGWLAVSPQTGTAPLDLTVAPSTSALAPGSYTATIRITPANGTPARDVAVTYDVAPPSLSVAPGSAAFTVTAATTPAELDQTLALSDAGTTLVYSASTTAPWLSAAPLSGATSTDPTLTISLVAAELALLADGAHAAEVILSYAEPSGATVELRVPVTLDLSLPRVSFVAPLVATSGAGAEVIVRGTGLLGATGVSFGASAATAVTVTSATEVRATHPPLAAGAYPVRVSNGLGLDLGGPSLAVVDPVTRTADFTLAAGAKTSIVFDDARATAWVAGAGVVERYREMNGWLQETVALAGLRDLALSPDGTKVVAVAGAQIWEIDAAADGLFLPALPAATITGYDASSDWRIAFANDGMAVLAANDTGYAACRRYDFRAKTVSSLASCSYYRGGVGAAGDGRRVVMAGTGLSPPQHIGHYDASAGAFQASLVQAGFNVVAPDRTASRVIFLSEAFPNPISNSVRDGAYTALGALPSTTLRALPSSDGTRAYGWDSSGKVRVFDLTAAPVGGIYPELGTPGGTAPAAVPGAGVRMALSADGRTLFLAGDQDFVVFPLP